MPEDRDPSSMVGEWLKILGIDRICEWDVLVFLYRHRTALVTPDQIVGLLGYPTSAALAALDHLESLGIVERSRLSQGARMYRFHRPPDSRGRAWDQLVPFAQRRAGRLILTKLLAAAADLDRDSKAPGARSDNLCLDGTPLRSTGVVVKIRSRQRPGRQAERQKDKVRWQKAI